MDFKAFDNARATVPLKRTVLACANVANFRLHCGGRSERVRVKKALLADMLTGG